MHYRIVFVLEYVSVCYRTVCSICVTIGIYVFQDQVLLQLPSNEIAQACYVKETGLHILAIKHGKYSFILN